MGVVLGLIAVSFGIWGIGDIFRGFGTSTVATVGRTEIRVDTFRQLYQDRLQQLGRQFNRPILPDQAKALGLDRQVLGEVIAETALDDRARAMRLNVSDAEVARQVTINPGFKGINGQFDRNRFEQGLRNIGYTEARFLSEQRKIALRQQLLGTVSGEPPVPKTALEAFNRFQNEERTIEYVSLGPTQAGTLAEPTPEVLAKYFEERKAAFRAPEYRKITVVVLTPQDLASRIEVPEADLKKAYADRKARYETPERRHLKQIVFPNIDEAKAAADRLAQGTTFETLAAERGLKETDIDLGTVAKSAVVDRDVADAAFALQTGAVSAPIQGRFGIAIVKVDAIEAGKTRPFEDVVDELKRDMQNERAKNEITNVQEKIEDERLGGATLADAARKFNLKPRVIEAIERDGKDAQGNPVADLPQNVDVLNAAFSAEVHGENEPLRVPGNGGYVWFDVDAITPARDRPLAEVKDQVVARWRDDEIATRLKAKAAEMLDKIKGGTSFADAAAANKLKIEWRPGIKRSGPPTGLSPAAVTEVFKTPQDSVGSVEANPTERIVFRVTEIKVAPLDPEAADAKRIDEALRARVTEDLIAQYLAHVQGEIGVSVNQTALNQAAGGAQN
ncbi:MAG: peptidyl-prolyl cis-trans isomerase [Alphaproteobacteria bacterium]|nr:peptidyl-prolyl cis-trans isomerase [Alphaproteobacteria bacterium]